MITIVEPKKHIADLWGQQRIRQGATFRQMRYVLRVDHEGKVLLHNVVTGQLAVLSLEEAEAIQTLPSPYALVMEELIKAHYLVPEDYDEHQQVVNLRKVLRNFVETHQSQDITHYTILPTTACNARCYYCFEKGVKTVTMTKQTADDVVTFIDCHCGETRSVSIRWFGGEPTVASERIDQICSGLKSKGIAFSSAITTNAYLFDEGLVERAKSLWNLESAHITIDGTGQNYNRIKNYVNPQDNPYERVMWNVGLLLSQGIYVQLRMNFDINNFYDFANLVDDVKKRFGNNPLLHVFAHPINGETRQGTNAWFEQKLVELLDLARNAGLYRKEQKLPCLEYVGCAAMNVGSTTITAEGKLVRCSEQFGDDQVTGNLHETVTDESVIQSWKQIADYEKCANCYLFPHCLQIMNCSVKDECLYQAEYTREYSTIMVNRFRYRSV